MPYKEYKNYNPRNDQDWTDFKGCLIIFILVAALFIAGFGIYKLLSPKQEETDILPYHTHDSMTITYTYNGESIRYYVMVDPDTNIQYIVNDRGGMCRREGI